MHADSVYRQLSRSLTFDRLSHNLPADIDDCPAFAPSAKRARDRLAALLSERVQTDSHTNKIERMASGSRHDDGGRKARKPLRDSPKGFRLFMTASAFSTPLPGPAPSPSGFSNLNLAPGLERAVADAGYTV